MQAEGRVVAQSETDYFKQRAAREAELALAANRPEVKQAHAALAALYRERLDRAPQERPRLAS